MSLERLTKDDIKGQILGLQFQHTGKITVCILTTLCGYQVVGTSGTIDVNSFDKELGEKYAFEDAFNKLWGLEAYYLERVYRLHHRADLTELFRTANGSEIAFLPEEKINRYLTD